MKCSNVTRHLLLGFLACLLVKVLPAQNSKPITFKRLVDTLKIHILSEGEIAKIVREQGVDFELSPEKESELRAAGAGTGLVVIVRASYRRPPSTEKAQPPAAATGLTATVGNGQLTLTWNPSAGATSYNVKRSPTNGGPYSTVSSPTTTTFTDTGLANGTTYYYVVSALNTAGQSPNSTQVSAAPANAPALNSIREVKKLYIQKMPNDLDKYISAEISRQMPGRLLLVLRLEDADAVMKGTSTNRRGNVTITDLRGTAELWAGEAGDVNIFRPTVHGGEKRVAERLVSSLKKALQ